MASKSFDDEYYLRFEDAFRGSRAEILERLRIYEPLLSMASEQGNIIVRGLDIGCGRGEWLELCNRKGFKVVGVDLNSCMVDFCLKNGLQAFEAEGKSYLEGQPDNSLEIISLFHVIEHLNRSRLEGLVLECLRVLAPSGILVMETPSSDNLIVASKGFYADPTHLRPIHPETTCFELQYLGFNWANAFYVNGNHSYRDGNPLGLTSILVGTANDVAIIAQKQGIKGQLDQTSSWTSLLRTNETTLQAATRIDSEHLQKYVTLNERLDRLESEAQKTINQLILTQQSLNLAHAKINSLTNSRIWKATKPLRLLILALKRRAKV